MLLLQLLYFLSTNYTFWICAETIVVNTTELFNFVDYIFIFQGRCNLVVIDLWRAQVRLW